MATGAAIEDLKRFAQKTIEHVPVVILGSGASASTGMPGMEALAEHLVKTVDVTSFNATDNAAWNAFKEAIKTNDLETALQSIAMTDAVNERIILATWSLIGEFDRNVFARVIADELKLPLTTLLRRLFQSTHNAIDVVTTNYDLLAEYAVEAGEFHHHSGFTYGSYRRWHEAPLEVSSHGKRVRTVNVWKVHGSLDWFLKPDGQVVGLPPSPTVPERMLPLIVTPGLAKYRRTHLDPFRTILAAADNAILNGRSYLCIGYGFNDEHIQPKLIRRCERDSLPIVVLARSLTPAAKSFLLSGKCANFIAFERYTAGTRIYSPATPGGADFAGVDLWDFEKFLSAML